MRRFHCAAFTAVAVIGFASVASAADLPVRAPVPVVAPYNWTGFYVGGNIGYSWGNGDVNYTDPGPPTSFSGSQKINGFIGGGQIGYNWQANNTWVFGLEADFQGSGETNRGSFSDPFPCDGTCSIDGTLESNIQWFGTVRGRIGVLVNPTLLVYGTGGLAYGSIKISGIITDNSVPITWAFGGSATHTGWTVGAGIEGAIPVSDWTWKVEYLYIDFGSISGSGIEADFGTAYSFSTKVTDNIVRVGLNYRFH
jgi:outer membrane immunogenic protein